MASRGGSKEQWWVSFIGTGDVTYENAKALLDGFLPNDGSEITIALPDNIKRSDKGMKTVQEILKEWNLDYTQEVPQDVVNQTLHRKDDPAYLIVLWDEDQEPDDEFVELVERAIKKGTPVKNLCAALDDVEITEDEAPAQDETAPRQHGKPRGDGVTMEVAGPATLAPSQPAANSYAEMLLAGIRAIVHEEIAAMGLSIGHNTFITDLSAQDTEVKIKAYVDSDGNYERAPAGRTKAPRGKKTVELTPAEAAEVGI